MVLVRSDLDFNLKSVEGDLISEDNKLVTNKLQELNVSPLDAFRLTCVIEALPIEWPIFLKTCNYSVSELLVKLTKSGSVKLKWSKCLTQQSRI